MQSNPPSLLEKCGLNSASIFFKRLQDLLRPDVEHLPWNFPAIIPRTLSKTPSLDLQAVIDASRPDVENTCSAPELCGTHDSEPSDLFRNLYAPSGKWEWMRGYDIVDEHSTFLSDDSMCSTYYKTGHVGGRELKYMCKSWQTNSRCDNSFYSELSLYKKQLKPLQGRCIPNVIGVYTAPGALNVAMEPPHNSFWIEASTDMPLSLKKRCIDAFTEIHSRGVLHGKVELGHMLIGGDGNVTIVDFQQSGTTEPNEKVFLALATGADLRKEMRKVKVKIDYPGARAYEKEKRLRCLRRPSVDASYCSPQEEKVEEDDVLNPPVLDAQEWQDWMTSSSCPRLFIVPGQSLQERMACYQAFLVSLESSFIPTSDLTTPTPSGNNKPNGGGGSASQIQREESRARAPIPPQVPALSRPLSTPRSSVLPSIDLDLSSPRLPGGSSEHCDRAVLRPLSKFPLQAPGELSSQALDLKQARFQLKRATFSDDQSGRLTKRIRLDRDAKEFESSASFVVEKSNSSNKGHPAFDAHSSSSASPSLLSGDKFSGLGNYQWLPNLRYPSLPVSQKEEDQRSWSRVAMENLGRCALQELPHPDLVRLYPHHPRWSDPDVQVFLGRLERSEKESAWAALLNPDKRFSAPRHPRSLGNLKRTLSEIQDDLQHTTADALIRGKRPRRDLNDVSDGNAEVVAVLPDDRFHNATSLSRSRRVRFTCDSEKSSPFATTRHISINPFHWYQQPLDFVRQILSWM